MVVKLTNIIVFLKKKNPNKRMFIMFLFYTGVFLIKKKKSVGGGDLTDQSLCDRLVWTPAIDHFLLSIIRPGLNEEADALAAEQS